MRRDEASLQQGEVQYRCGAIMGLTVAESFMLITFLLLMLLALWRIEKEDETAWLNNLTPRQIAAVAAAARDGGLDTFIELRKAGMDLASTLSGSTSERVTVPSARLAVIEERARLVSEEDIRQLAEAAAALDPDERRKLTDLVKLDEFKQAIERLNALKDVLAGKSVDEIAKALDMAEAAGEEGLNDADALRERIRSRLAEEEAAQEALVDNLRNELGDSVARMGGQIKDDGAVVLPDELLFPVGSAELLVPLERFLEGFCRPWLVTLRNSGLDIDEIRIEGHASSEWRGAADTRDAFVRNLDLSQRRALAVLERCLGQAGDTADGDWARRHLTAVGYSSSRLVQIDGRESPEFSRRVVFNTSLNRNRLLEEIGGEVATTQAETLERPLHDN